MDNLTESQKIDAILDNFNYTIQEHTKYTIGHVPVFKKMLIDKYKTPEKIHIALTTLNNLPFNAFYTDKDLFRIVDYNLKFKEKFKHRIENMVLGDNISLKYASSEIHFPFGVALKHPEAPYQINVFVDGKEIGSFNFMFIFRNNEKQLLINLIQGKKGVEREHLRKINKPLGNWKQKIVENLVSIAKSFKATPIGVLPQRFKVPGITNDEYQRIIKTYLEAFIYGGINPRNINFDKVDNGTLKNLKESLKEITNKKPKRNKIEKEPLWKKIRKPKH